MEVHILVGQQASLKVLQGVEIGVIFKKLGNARIFPRGIYWLRVIIALRHGGTMFINTSAISFQHPLSCSPFFTQFEKHAKWQWCLTSLSDVAKAQKEKKRTVCTQQPRLSGVPKAQRRAQNSAHAHNLSHSLNGHQRKWHLAQCQRCIQMSIFFPT